MSFLDKGTSAERVLDLELEEALKVASEPWLASLEKKD